MRCICIGRTMSWCKNELRATQNPFALCATPKAVFELWRNVVASAIRRGSRGLSGRGIIDGRETRESGGTQSIQSHVARLLHQAVSPHLDSLMSNALQLHSITDWWHLPKTLPLKEIDGLKEIEGKLYREFGVKNKAH